MHTTEQTLTTKICHTARIPFFCFNSRLCPSSVLFISAFDEKTCQWYFRGLTQLRGQTAWVSCFPPAFVWTLRGWSHRCECAVTDARADPTTPRRCRVTPDSIWPLGRRHGITPENNGTWICSQENVAGWVLLNEEEKKSFLFLGDSASLRGIVSNLSGIKSRLRI